MAISQPEPLTLESRGLKKGMGISIWAFHPPLHLAVLNHKISQKLFDKLNIITCMCASPIPTTTIKGLN